MARSNIIEVSCNEAIVAYTDKFFRRVSAQTPAIPASFAGKYILSTLIATDIAPTEAQMDVLETAIEGLTGVHKAFVLIGPARIPLDVVPAGNDLRVNVEAGFSITPTPVS